MFLNCIQKKTNCRHADFTKALGMIKVARQIYIILVMSLTNFQELNEDFNKNIYDNSSDEDNDISKIKKRFQKKSKYKEKSTQLLSSPKPVSRPKF